MKGFAVLLAVLVVVSCTEPTKPQPASSTPRPALIPKDSVLAHRDSVNPYAPVDISPMDIAYFPQDYPMQKMEGKARPDPVARLIYSRPHRQGRRIFGSLLRYGSPWRLGANEATEIEFFRPVTIQGKQVAKGRYLLYCIPQPDKWTLVFNTNRYAWGLNARSEYDVYRFNIPVLATDQPLEYFSAVFRPSGDSAMLIMAWDNVEARLTFQY